MNKYIVIAVYDLGYGGFNWQTDIESIDNKNCALDISYRVDLMDYRSRMDNGDRRQQIYKELVSDLASLYPELRLVIRVDNDYIRIVDMEANNNG